MLAASPVGRDAQTKKYDILTALGAHACHATPALQRLTLRLVTLITARYNWRTDELTVGRRDIARLWGVEERTVKREMARLKSMGWVMVKQAGVRGRVTAYALDLAAILRATETSWSAVGPDFVARMQVLTGQGATLPAPVAHLSNVVPFRPRAPEPDDSEWGRACHLLAAEEPGCFQTWIAPLCRVGFDEGMLELAAPSRFHANYVATHLLGRLHGAVMRVTPEVRSIRVTG
ncbi:hypothetical protein ORIO_22620 (plasmid) [Cereibacter azotoformans]|uniref:DnaA N-terminal domain-containing protein n=1 Tax=Cereibacter azotoformans TaxID=43057 RepID=UPI001EEBB7B3|nr:DnaA N-terminal domain-containing protein [Cereibacter azotoformans]ULB12568.1 hypothetical protein ORIO_22620 [Cereibacter azotoformans]